MSVDSNVKKEVGEFNRIEEKYIAPIGQFMGILGALHEHMTPSYLDQGTIFTLIESLYFDSPELDFFHHHMSGQTHRYKLRVRRYAPNGKWSAGTILLELKAKEGEHTKKTRFMLDVANFHRLINGKVICDTGAIRNLNLDLKLELLQKRIDGVNQLINKFSLIPVLSVQYKRYAFERGEFRVTVDQEISVQLKGQSSVHHSVEEIPSRIGAQRSEKFADKYRPQTHIVIEIKHQGEIPLYAQEIIKEFMLQKAGFSKYCWGLVQSAKHFEELSHSTLAVAAGG